MGIRFGNFDPLQLTFNIIGILLEKGSLTADEARNIIKGALPPEMPDNEKNRIVDSMIVTKS